MSIRETRRQSRARWPLQFDLEGVPRDNATRELMLRDLRADNNPEINQMNVPQVKNTFAGEDGGELLDALSPAQKQKLLKALLADAPGGQEFDLSKPPVEPYRFKEFPKCMYAPDGKSVVVHSDEQEKELLKRKFTTKPVKKHDADDKDAA